MARFPLLGRKDKEDLSPLDRTIRELGESASAARPMCRPLVDYLSTVKANRAADPFDDEQLLCDAVLILSHSPENHLGDSIQDTMKATIAPCCHQILPLGEETRDYAVARELFLYLLTAEGRPLLEHFDAAVYALFEDKQSYLEVMRSIEDNIAVRPYRKHLHDYMLVNRVYFAAEEPFRAAVFKAVDRLVLIRSSKEAAELLSALSEENRKRAGIYEFSESDLQRLSEQAARSGSVRESLAQATEAAQNTQRVLERKQKLALSELGSVSRHYLSTLEQNSANALAEVQNRTAELLRQFREKTSGAIAAFEREYNQYMEQQKTDVQFEKDSLVRDYVAVFREYEAKLRALMTDVSQRTSVELRRVRSEVSEQSEAALSELRGFIESETQLQKRMESSKPAAELLEKYEAITRTIEQIDVEGLQKLGTSQATMADGGHHYATVSAVIPREERMPINPFMDKSIPYKTRFTELMERKKREMDKGVLFHCLFDDFIALLLEDWNPYVWGPSGCGKTYMINQAAILIGVRFFDIGRVNEPYEILGAGTITGGYTRPPFFQGYAGGGIVFADEIDASSPLATITFNNFTSNSYYIFPHYGRADRHPNFRFVAAGNTRGSGADSDYMRERIDGSLQQRLTPLEFTYDSRVEKAIFSDKYSDWYEFSQMFRHATDEWGVENGREAPGTFTTRDTARVRNSLDNGSLSEDKIVRFQFIENKELPYLKSLSQKLDRHYRGRERTSLRLKQSFDRQIAEMERQTL